MASAIGPFTFADLSAPPPLTVAQMIARVRPGTNGVMVQNLGVKAAPFEVESDAKAVNFTAAMNLYVAYRMLVGAPSQPVIWANHPYLLTGHRFFVLDVQPLEIRSVLSGIGPYGTYGAEVRCRWKLQPVTLANA